MELEPNDLIYLK